MPVISTNTAANTAVRYLNANSSEQSESLAKLSSGSRINKASDDAAGLAISTKISSDVTALEQASTNASHGISILQTADGGAANVSDILERMKTLASQAASGTVTDTERAYIQAEFEQLLEEIDGISTSTRYNGQSLLDGTSDFSDDGTEATITTSLTSASTIAGADGETLSFDVNGTTIELTVGATETGVITADDILNAVNAEGTATGVIASYDDSGNLQFQSTGVGAEETVTLDNVTVGADNVTLASADLTDFGVADTGGDGDATETATGTDAATTGATVVVGSDASDTITLTIASLTTEALGIDELDVSTQEGAEAALNLIDVAIDEVSNARAEMGATMSRFEFRSSQIDTSIENLEAAESAIADVDIAAEQADLSSASVKVQAAVAAAAQANQMPENLLQLLQ